ncbi:MAG: hypothetical protein A4E71_01865 [Smithella sp. PtaU1.Bin162]|nr:MAG: hypothetical protein A4E71_01865 [Smithella sp. PtaU1.Bin162]
MKVLLQHNALNVEEWLEQHYLDGNGIVYTFLDKQTCQPPEEALFHDTGPRKNVWDFSVEGFSRSEVAAYENCGMCTGSYLQALLFRYRVEKDSVALDRAGRCFRALCYIYELGKQFEEGFFPKIYGNRFSYETSTDQVLYTVMALDKFYEYAAPQEQAAIRVMIPNMVMFWVKRNYRYTYFGRQDMQWPLVRFPSLLLLAYQYSGTEKFRKEYDRLLAQGLTREPEYTTIARRKKPDDYEFKHGAWLINGMADSFTMDVIELDYLLTNDSRNRLYPAWKESVLEIWNDAKLTLAPNGKYYTQVWVDLKTGEIRRLPCGEEDSYQPGVESGWSTMIVRGAVTAAKYYPGNEIIKNAVIKVLRSLGIKDLTYYDEPDRLLPEYRFKTRFLSGDSITNWLWAYWQGRYQNLITETE